MKRNRPTLTLGMRVRLRAPDPGLTLPTDLATVVGPDEHDGSLGYCVVRLDAPGLYDHGGDKPELLNEVVELVDNMDVLAAEMPSVTAARYQRDST